MDEEKDVFISYNWHIKSQVQVLDKGLSDSGLKVWRDIRDLQVRYMPLTSQLANGIKRAKVIICCITRKYCESFSCNNEIEFAIDLAKPTIVLMIDNLKTTEICDIQVTNRRYCSGIGFLIASCLRENCYEDGSDWPSKRLEKIKSLVNELIKETEKQSNQSSNITLSENKFSIEKDSKSKILEKNQEPSDNNKKIQINNITDLISKEEADALYNKDNSFPELGKDEEAIDCYNEEIKFNSNYAIAFRNKGAMLNNLGKYTDALGCYDRPLKLDPNDSITISWEGIILTKLSRYQEAIIYFENAIKINETNAEALNGKGFCLFKLGKHQEAIDLFNKAIKLNPNFDDAFLNKAACLNRLDNYQEAIDCCNKASEININNANVLVLKGLILEELDGCKPAISLNKVSKKLFERVLELIKNPKNDQDFLIEGDALSLLGRFQEALECYDKATRLNPYFYEAFNGKANSLDKLNRYEEAIECYEKSIQINPNICDAYYFKGICLDKMNKYQEAIDCYDKAIELYPDFYQAYIEKGNNLEKFVRYRIPSKVVDANMDNIYLKQVCFNQAIKIKPKCAHAFCGKGKVFSNTNFDHKAIESYDEAIKLSPNCYHAYTGKGYCLMNLKDFVEAIDYFDKAIQINPSYAAAFKGKGECLARLSKYEEAIIFFDKAIEFFEKTLPRDPELAAVFKEKSDCLARLGGNQGAIECFEKAPEIEIPYSEVLNAIDISLDKQATNQEAIVTPEQLTKTDPNNTSLKNGRISSGFNSKYIASIRSLSGHNIFKSFFCPDEMKKQNLLKQNQ